MTQSVELLLDPVAEAAVEREWEALHAAALPSEVRAPPVGSHRPHLTLYAGAEITAETDDLLARLVADLRLDVQLGALTLFGPARGSYVLVHAVVPTVGLLELQRAVAQACGADRGGYFAPGRWTPHVTLARRMAAEQLPGALAVLRHCSGVGQQVHITSCRRWDSAARQTWLLSPFAA